MSKLLAALLVLTLSAPAFAADTLAARFAGNWRGVGVQTGDQEWAMELTLTPIGATVDYPGSPCGGTWVFSQVQADRTIATEVLSYGRDACIDNSVVILTRHDKGRLMVIWKNPDGSDLALAVLYPEDAKPRPFKVERSESMRAWRNR